MKLLWTGIGIILVSTWALSALSRSRIHASPGKSGMERAPVVVELFTSEGCSSCPPADALLAKLFKEQPVEGAEVIALEEHVDYWDSLGWKDPFSSNKWTQRQEEYAETLRTNVYTPQMVVDGQAEFVGSRERQSEREIAEGSRHAKTRVILSPNGTNADGRLQYSVHVGKLEGSMSGDTAEVWLAIAEDNLQSAVTRGENAGAQLRHTSVLRTMRKLGLADASKEQAFSGSAEVRLDQAWKRENTRIVVLVQERKSRRILGAAKAELTP